MIKGFAKAMNKFSGSIYSIEGTIVRLNSKVLNFFFEFLPLIFYRKYSMWQINYTRPFKSQK